MNIPLLSYFKLSKIRSHTFGGIISEKGKKKKRFKVTVRPFTDSQMQDTLIKVWIFIHLILSFNKKMTCHMKRKDICECSPAKMCVNKLPFKLYCMIKGRATFTNT